MSFFSFSQVVSACITHLALPACQLFFYRHSLFASIRQLEDWTVCPLLIAAFLLLHFPNKHTIKEMLTLISLLEKTITENRKWTYLPTHFHPL